VIESLTFLDPTSATLLMHEFWSHCIAHFARTLNVQQLNTWIKPLTVQVSAEQILVNAPSRFVADWVRGKFLHEIDLLARDFFTDPPPIQLLVVENRNHGSLPETSETLVAPVILERTPAPSPPDMDTVKHRPARQLTAAKNE